MSDRKKELLQSISSTIGDFRAGDGIRCDAEHVERWITQFPAKSRDAILLELDHVLKKTYISKEKCEEFISTIIRMPELAGSNPKASWKWYKFLPIQFQGESQRDMLRLFDTVLQKECEIRIEDCGKEERDANIFLYLDDCIFTGNHLKNDLVPWTETHAPHQAQVNIVVLASYAEGWDFSTKLIASAANQRRISLKLRLHCPLSFDLSDRLSPTIQPADRLTSEYAAGLRRSRYRLRFRDAVKASSHDLFRSEGGRQLLEEEFIKAGVRIRASSPTRLHDDYRPLGYDPLNTWGFGGLIIPYRNCPNTCPLALWVETDSWYPLFPRKGNMQARRMSLTDL